MQKTKEQKAITLITLIITIIIMLILASVTIHLTLGDNGIFTKAKEAKKQMEIATIKEQIQMDILTEKLGSNGDITKDKLSEILDKYGKVQTDEEGNITGVKTDEGDYDIPLEDILNNEPIKPTTPTTPTTPGGSKEEKIKSIILDKKTLELQEGNKLTLTITIQPENAENKEVEWVSDNTGVATVDEQGQITAVKEGTATITVSAKSDSSIKDQCKVTVTKSVALPGTGGYEGGEYNDPYIPKGFTHTEGTWNTGYTIKGNGTEAAPDEFVWVPCTTTDEQQVVAQNREDIVQILENKVTGAYAFKDSTKVVKLTADGHEIDESIVKIRESVGKYGGFYIAKYEAGTNAAQHNSDLSVKKVTNGGYKPLSQANKYLWNSISLEDAKTVSEAMISYEETGARSTLISGEAWDTTLKWITETGDSSFAANSDNKGNHSGKLALTGSNPNYSKNNIYDLAGNVMEHTTETYGGNKSNYISGYVQRGGIYYQSGKDYPAAYRETWSGSTATSLYCGFRVVLYK